MMMKTNLVRVLAVTAGLWAAAAPVRADWRGENLASRFERLQQAAPAGRQAGEWQAMAAEERFDTRRDWSQQLAGLPHEQRQQMRQQMREQWRQAAPDARDQRREANPGQWQQMPREDRSRLREEMRENRGGWGGRRNGWR